MLVKIEDVSIADLKAAFDFNLIQIEDVKKQLLDAGKTVENNGAYKELMVVHHNLYMGLANKVTNIEINFK